MKLSTELPEIIRLAKAIQSYWNRELPKRHPNYPFIQEGADDGPPPPEVDELRVILETLTDEQIYTLLTLQSIGRGLYSVERWQSRWQVMHQSFPLRSQAITVLLIMPLVGDFLQNGLELIEQQGWEIDELAMTPMAHV